MQSFYTVRSGETLNQIAERWKIPIKSLIAANNISHPYIIQPGDQLSMPPGVNRYRVKEGDTIETIVEQFHIPRSIIIEANQLVPPYEIVPDQLLLIPQGIPYYIVQSGDTLYSIGQKYNVVTNERVDVESIRQVNRLTSDIILPGMRLIIPYVPPGENGYIAYTTNMNGNFDIWLYHPLNGEKRQVTFGLGESYTIPYWSKDSLKIAFVGKNQILYILYLPTLSIAQIDQLTDTVNARIDWSPDHRKIVYSNQSQIVIYDVYTHYALGIKENQPRDPQWFPNGKEILYQALDEKGVPQLYRIQTNGKNKKQLTKNKDESLNYVRLSSDGKYVLYTTPDASISFIRTIELDTGKTYEIQGGPLSKNYYPEWSPNSEKIAYSASAYDTLGYFSEIRLTDSQGEKDHIWAISNCFSSPVTWSPDSLKIAYLSGCSNETGASEIWMIHLYHPVPIRIVADGATITSVQWSTVSSHPAVVGTYVNTLYRVMFQYPNHWQKVTKERYEGIDGFFQISAIATDEPVEQVCKNEAFHPLQPYGSNPIMFPFLIQNEHACLIWPSDDQKQEMRNQAAIIARYPNPIHLKGKKYQYFILWASKQHIYLIASSLKFINNNARQY